MDQLLDIRPEYRYAYVQYPEFRAAVQSMVTLIPLTLAVAYDEAQKAEKTRATLTDLATSMNRLDATIEKLEGSRMAGWHEIYYGHNR